MFNIKELSYHHFIYLLTVGLCVLPPVLLVSLVYVGQQNLPPAVAVPAIHTVENLSTCPTICNIQESKYNKEINVNYINRHTCAGVTVKNNFLLTVSIARYTAT
jgi:hypothetical protein